MMQTVKEMLKFLIESFQTYSAGNRIWLLYPAALIVILIFGKKQEKKLFIGSLVLEVLTLFNPVFVKVFLEVFDLSNRYLRFFWMVLYFVTIAYAMVLLIFRFKSPVWRVLSCIVCAALVLILGNPVFWGENAPSYETADNGYFIGDEILELCGIFHSEGLERPVVLYGGLLLTYRQYDPTVESWLHKTDFQVMQGTSLEDFKNLPQYNDVTKEICRVFYYNDFSVAAEDFYDHLANRANYIVSQSFELDEYLQAIPVELIGQTQNYRIWKLLPKEQE